MKSLEKILENRCIWNHKTMFPAHEAEIGLPDCGICRVIWERVNGYEHVAASPQDPGSQNKYLLPTGNDMRALKDIFFGDEEVEHKFSIKKYQYANLNGAEGWLHLWKPVGHEIDELVKREGEQMRNVLFYIAGAATVGVFFTLWCAVAVQRVRKESEESKYGELCARIQKQIDETRMRISSVKMQLHIADHALDQALLQWKYEYLMKQEQWLIELMCGKIEEEKQEEKQ